MSLQQAKGWTRRHFLSGLTLAGTAGLLGLPPRRLAAEPPPEMTRLKLHRGPVCIAPQYVAEELLWTEGFTHVEYLQMSRVEANRALAAGEVPIVIQFAGSALILVDAGDPVVMLSGLHVGCFELFGTDRVRSLRDLKGKTVGVTELGTGRHTFLASALAYVGLDPRQDVQFATYPPVEAMHRLADSQIDAYQAFGEEVHTLRALKIGHVILNSAVDRPWSQYFCCMVTANRDFVTAHPVATKRALRAILKAADVCAAEPVRASRLLVERGHTPDYEAALQTLKELPYGRWREYEPEDTVRFYALRLHEVGMIKSTPQKIIGQGTDWRFLNELKKELKG
jgi:NitT/TauT family transport system substrate-binding protein